LGEIEIYYSELTAQRRREAAGDKPEPSWIGRAKIWTPVLNAAIALRRAARFRPVQYLAALIFIVASVGIFTVFSFVIAVLLTASLDSRNVSSQDLLVRLLAPAAVWLAVSPVIGVFIALFSRRRTCSRPLTVVRFMGSPAREFLRAWDGICFRVDKKIGRVLATPLVWLLKKPSRFITLAVISILGFVVTAYGLLVPAEMVAWGNQFGSGLRAVGGGGFTFVIILMITYILAVLTFMLLVVYVWFRSALVALPSLLVYAISRPLAADLPDLKPYWGPVVELVTYVPPGIAEAYGQTPESWPAAVMVGLLKVFVGSPGFPTTIGMIMTGVLIGWLPYVLERLDKPTPREVVARHGWDAANEHVEAARKHQVFVNALWGGGFAVFFFALAPVGYLLSSMEKLGWVTFLLVVIPVGTGLLVLRAIVKKTRKSGRITRPRPLDISAAEATNNLGEPEKVSSIAENYSALARLLSEAQRRRSLAPAEEPAAV
jgi:hypothetical protein